MISSNVSLVAAYGFVIIGLGGLIGFYIWRNLALTRQIKRLDSSPILQQSVGKKQFKLLALLPFICFCALALVILFHLDSETQGEGSAVMMVGEPLPAIDLPVLFSQNGQQKLTIESFDGRVTLVNFWASWCGPCRLEHPLLMQLAQDSRFDLVGINYKDRADNGLHFLGQLGNPFMLVGADIRGRAAIEWGVYGVPESYLIDRQGIILYRHIGPLTLESVTAKLLPAIEAALR